MFQFHYQTTRPITTAHLAQTMTLLSLTADELKQQIESELASNPALELVDERRCPTCRRILPHSGPCPVCSRPQTLRPDEPIVFVSPREDFYTGGGMASSGEMPDDPYSPMVEDLPTYVMRQIAPDVPADDRKLVAYLLTHLDEDGLLTTSLAEVARYFHFSLERVRSAQRMIQRADPVGVGSCTPSEALLVQLEALAETQPVPHHAREVVEQGLEVLSRKQYHEIAKAIGITTAQVQRVAQFIGDNLNPYPARTHWGDTRQPSAPLTEVFYQPDIIIGRSSEQAEGPLVVEIIMPLRGTLRVNPLYRQALHQAGDEQKDGLKEDLERASLFVKCLQQRNHTIHRLIQQVVMLQREFILRGDKHLKPVTRAQLAEVLEVHESTISRAVANKAVQLPNRRIIPLADFFDRSLGVRTVLREIISQETRPLSDSDLVDLLSHQGYSVARRTVAKYRAMEGILPANMRHAVKQPARG